jgi:hypothetical protein
VSSDDPHEPVTVTDKRRVDPETGEIRQQAAGPAPSGPAPAAEPAAVPSDSADKVAELTADLQRVQADFANYRKRALRDQQLIADRAKAAVIAQLLGVLDDLDRARSHGDLETTPRCTRPCSTRATGHTPSSVPSCGAATRSAIRWCATPWSAWWTRSRLPVKPLTTPTPRPVRTQNQSSRTTRQLGR